MKNKAIAVLLMLLMAVMPFTAAGKPEPLGTGMSPGFVIGDTTDNSDNPNDGDSGSDTTESSSGGSGSGSSGGGSSGGGYAKADADSSAEEESDGNDSGNSAERRIVSAIISLTNQNRIRVLNRLAENDENIAQVVNELPDNMTEILSQLPRAEQKKLLEMSREQLMENLANYSLVAVKKELQFAKRIITQEQIETAQQNAAEAKQNYIDAKAELEQKRIELANAIAEKQQNQTRERVREYLENSADVMISSLERARYNIEMNDDISDEEAERIMNEIDAQIQNMNEAKQLAVEAQTDEELQNAKQAILEAVQSAKEVIEESSNTLIDSKLSEVVTRYEALEVKLDCTLAEMEADSIDVSGIDAMMDEFSAEVADAKDSLEAGDFDSASSGLKEAYNTLKQIVSSIKELGGEITECQAPDGLAEDEVLVVEEQ